LQLRVFNVLRHWIEDHFYDFQDNLQLTVRISRFIESKMRRETPGIADRLMKIFTRAQSLSAAHLKPTLVRPPKPLLNRRVLSLEFILLDVPVAESARQLTLLEHSLFCRILPHEWVSKYLNPNAMYVCV
jgi:son of sevenless